MSSIRLSGTTSGHYDLTVPAAAGTNSIDLSNLQMSNADFAGNVTVGSGKTLNVSNGTVTKAAGQFVEPGGLLRRYYGSLGSGVTVSGSFVDVVSIPNIVVNSGETPWLTVHATTRQISGTYQHVALGGYITGSATQWIGDAGWGFGIDYADFSWNVYSISPINLKTGLRSNNWTSTGTFTFYLKGRTNTNSVMIGGETGSPTAGYGHTHVCIDVCKDI